jgi:hypothetical protein
LVIDNKVIIELKVQEVPMNVHIAQLDDCLKATDIEVGLY